MNSICCSNNHCHCFQPRYNYKFDPKVLEIFGEIFNCEDRRVKIDNLDDVILSLRNLTYIYDICTHCGETRETIERRANW